MTIIPVINCADFECVKSRFNLAQEFMCDHGSSGRQLSAPCESWVHIDIADGGFTNNYTTWRHPTDLKKLHRQGHMKIEVHLMLNEPELALVEWLQAGIDRIIFHFETATEVDTLIQMCVDHKVEPWLAIAPQTAAEDVFAYLDIVKGCQILGVNPGLAGQALQPEALEKVRMIREAFPRLPIEVDGGITVETAALCAAAGATQVVAGTAIFTATDPAAAYRALKNAA